MAWWKEGWLERQTGRSPHLLVLLPGMCQDAFCSVVTAAQGFSYLSPPLSFSPFDDGWRDGQGA